MKHYVLGFLFSQTGESVALIRKDHPSRQVGKLNGIGGKIKLNESAHAAMRREFQEETGLLVTNWELFGDLGTPNAVGGLFGESDWLIELFRAQLPDGPLPTLTPEAAHTEVPVWVRVEDAVAAALNGERCWAGDALGTLGIMANLSWLLPLAKDTEISAQLADSGEAAT